MTTHDLTDQIIPTCPCGWTGKPQDVEWRTKAAVAQHQRSQSCTHVPSRPLQSPGTLEWLNHAACLDEDPALFDAEHNTRRANERATQALAICGTCPSVQDCLKDQMAFEGAARKSNRHTIRGGTLPAERAALYRAVHA